MPTLFELVKAFAEQSRQQLLEQAKNQQNELTRPVTFIGYDADGNAIVKDRGEIKTVVDHGNTSRTKGEIFIYDEAATVEYKRRKKPEEQQIISLSPIKPKPARKKILSRSSIEDAEVAEFELRLLEIGLVHTAEVRYSWNNGTDLDTTTWIGTVNSSPANDGPVGWAHGSSSTYMVWSGDDTSSNGLEVVTVDGAKLYEDLGEFSKIITMQGNGNWYNTAGTSAEVEVITKRIDGSTIQSQSWTAPLTLFERGGTGTMIGKFTIDLGSGEIIRTYP